MDFFFEQGRNAVFHGLGLEKTAAMPGMRAIRSAGGWLRSKMPTWASTKEFMIGSPRQFAEEVAAGKALKPGGLLRQSFKAESPLAKAFLYGAPALETGSILMDEEGRKAQRLGESLGGATLGLAAWRPFGMVGSMAADTLGRGIGRAVGRTVDYARRGGAPEPPMPPAVPNQIAQTPGQLSPVTSVAGRAVDYPSSFVSG